MRTSSMTSGYLRIDSTMILETRGGRGNKTIRFPMLESVLSGLIAFNIRRVSTAPRIASFGGLEIKSNVSKSVMPSSAMRRTTSERSVLKISSVV